jgi:Yip1 domain
MTPETVATIEPQPARMGELSRLAGIFFEPKATFTEIAQRPTWIVPMMLVMLSIIGVTTTIAQRIGWERIIRHQNETSSRVQQMPAEQREQALAMQMKLAPVIGYAGPIIGVPIVDVVIAAVLFGIAGGIMSGGMRFKQVFAVVC